MKISLWILLFLLTILCIYIALKIINKNVKKNQDDDIYPMWLKTLTQKMRMLDNKFISTLVAKY